MPAKSAEGAWGKQMRVQTFEQSSSVFVQNGGVAATKEERNRTAQQQGGKLLNKKSLIWGNNTVFDIPSCLNSDAEYYSFVFLTNCLGTVNKKLSKCKVIFIV